jgi:hypothetical protein
MSIFFPCFDIAVCPLGTMIAARFSLLRLRASLAGDAELVVARVAGRSGLCCIERSCAEAFCSPRASRWFDCSFAVWFLLSLVECAFEPLDKWAAVDVPRA